MSNYEQKKKEARQKAIDWQKENEISRKSYSQLINESAYFEKLGRRYGLLREFRENAIL